MIMFGKLYLPKGACCWADKQTIAAVDIPLLIDPGVSHTQQQSVDHRKEMVSNEPRNVPVMVRNYSLQIIGKKII